MNKIRFSDIQIGEKFDFVSPAIGYNSFFDQCIKISARKYQSVSTGLEFSVGSVNVEIFNVGVK